MLVRCFHSPHVTAYIPHAMYSFQLHHIPNSINFSPLIPDLNLYLYFY